MKFQVSIFRGLKRIYLAETLFRFDFIDVKWFKLRVSSLRKAFNIIVEASLGKCVFFASSLSGRQTERRQACTLPLMGHEGQTQHTITLITRIDGPQQPEQH